MDVRPAGFCFNTRSKARCLYASTRTLKRLGWQYIGVWKHSKSSNRLYFYAAIRINEGGMVGMNMKIKEYQRKKGKRISVIKNTYFSERFGSTVVNPLLRANRKLWKIVLGEINKKRAKIDARELIKRRLSVITSTGFEKRSTEEERSPTCLVRAEFFFGAFRLVFGACAWYARVARISMKNQAHAPQPVMTTSGQKRSLNYF